MGKEMCDVMKKDEEIGFKGAAGRGQGLLKGVNCGKDGEKMKV